MKQFIAAILISISFFASSSYADATKLQFEDIQMFTTVEEVKDAINTLKTSGKIRYSANHIAVMDKRIKELEAAGLPTDTSSYSSTHMTVTSQDDLTIKNFLVTTAYAVAYNDDKFTINEIAPKMMEILGEVQALSDQGSNAKFPQTINF